MLSVRSILLLLGTIVLLSSKGTSADLEDKEWWENTVVYQIWLRGFQDSDGDGEGDIRGIINRLDHFEELGIETIWLSPIYTSPLIDSGYDVSDYVNINPLFGVIDDFDELVEKAHDKDLKVILDVVPNHSSDQHYWFNASVYSVEPYTSYYIWASGTVVDGVNVPPNNWISTYSTEAGSSWTWNEIRQQWYYHKFHSSQPDLNLRNTVVVQELLDILTFWLERDVDGFHFSSVSYLFEDEGLSDEPTVGSGAYTSGLSENAGLLYEIHAHIADWVATNNSTSKLLIAGSDDDDSTLISYYGNDTHTGISPFNYRLIKDITANTNASAIKATIEEWLQLLPANQSTNWVLSNQDHSRVPSRVSLNHVDGLHILKFLLPGQTFTYYGEEIGMLDTTISWDQTIDPLACAQTADTYTTYSRDPARTPMQWDTTTSAGFSTSVSTYLPVNPNYLTRNVETQLSSDRTNIQTYKALASLKRKATITHGDYEISAVNSDRVLVLRRSLENYSTYVAIINLGLARQIVDLTELYSDLPEYLNIAVASNNAVTNSTIISVDAVSLTANAALVLTDEEEEETTESSTATADESMSSTTTVEDSTTGSDDQSTTEIETTTFSMTESEDTTTESTEISTTYPETSTSSTGGSSTPDIVVVNHVLEGNLDWWQSAVIYQIYPKSFQDSDNDGTGDLPGIISRLDHLVDLGVTGFWLSPIYTSPQKDGGYDVSNFIDIDPLFGTIEDFEELVEQAHDKGLKVIMDFIPNHSSDEHPWFINSISRIEPYTDYYVWVDGIVTADGIAPPNNWLSVFGGSAWSWNEERQQYYLHQFDSGQPDLNFRNPQVVQEMNDIITFWLDKGVDGFRMDAVSHIFEDPNLHDEPINPNPPENTIETDYDFLLHTYTKDQDETYELVYSWRALLDSYAARTDNLTRLQIIESFSTFDKVIPYQGNETHEGAHLSFNFGLIVNVTYTSGASVFIDEISSWLHSIPENSTANWVLGNHDWSRVASRFGINRADGLNMLSLLLPGIAFTYYGEEIAMLDTWISFEDTQDPHGINAGPDRYELFSRDPARTPFQWDNTTSAGFSGSETTWLPVNSNYLIRNLALHASRERSVYRTYKAIVEMKQTETIRRGSTRLLSLSDDNVLAFARELDNEDTYVIVINLSPYSNTVDVSAFGNLPSRITICLASANAIANTGDTVNIDSVSLSANAALVLCTKYLPNTVNEEINGALDWWQTAAIYQIYPKSFKDSNADGVGDIQGIISQFNYFNDIGIDAIWLGPIYTSPQKDGGYDISNYLDIDPLFGSMEEFETLLDSAHAQGIKVILDFVPNHSSDEHEWFVNSVARVAPYTDYYIWRDGVSTDSGINPPNNWISVFGGSAWTWNEQRQQYYLHQFGTNQPDLNLENQEVIEETNRILRFWLEKGVDGFRIGSVSHLVEDSSFRDEPINENADDSVLESDYDYLEHIYTTDQEKSFDLVVQWRSVIDDYVASTGSEKIFLTVETTSNTETALRFLGNDTNPGANAPLNFNIVKNVTRATSSAEIISLTTEWLNLLSKNITPNWVLGSHDFNRASSRLGVNRIDGLHMLSLLLPGLSVTYQGEELGLLNVPVPWSQTQDPKGLNAGESRFELFSRDPARTPFLWDSTSNAGFTTGSSTWLPITSDFQDWNLAVQSSEDRSYYNTYKSLIEFRKLETFRRGATKVQSLNDNTVIAFSRELSNEHTYLVVINVDIYRTTVDLTGFDNLIGEDLVVCLASANSIIDTGADINLSEVQLSANAALLLCPRLAFPKPVLVNDEIVGDLDWWQTAAIYQVYPKSFKDSNGDGVGDIQGIISQLDHFTNINIDAIWLGPVYTSPQYDHGYDVSNYRDVDPLFGTLADLESLLEQAHARGIKIILDFVPNHSSIEHEWFVNSVARVAPYTDYYIWRDGVSTDNGINPPNNWISVFGGSAWTWNEQRQQYYLHQFGTNQPDLNLENADVLSEINDILRFWLEKGFDGFRIGSVSHLVEDSSFRDEPINDNADDSVVESDYDYLEHIYTTNQEKSFDLVVQWRRVVDDYVASTGSETKFLAVETTANTHTALRFLGNDTNPGAHAPLNFNIVKNATRTSSSLDLLSVTIEWLNLLSENITPNWVLGSHDFDRVSSRFGINRVDGLHMLSLLLPGLSVTYQGEELGLLNVPVSWGQTQDPKGLNAGESRFELFSRDPARTPFLWDSTSNAGFTTGASTWLPITSDFQDWNLAVQSSEDRSYYNTYKSLIEFRKLETFRRGATKVQTLNDNTVIAFSRELSNEHTYLVVINVGIYRTSVDLTGFDNLLTEDLVVCLASANSITDTGTDVNLSEVQLSANAALLVCPRSALPEPITTTVPTTPADSTGSPIETETILANNEIIGDLDWWQTAAIYQVYPKSFKDSNGDGVGDIQGIISQLDHFTNINIDAIWLGPVYTSPQYDHGYDVSNYRDVDPLFGTLADLESLLEQAHARGIKIILDFVPNHSSIEHEWFVNSVARVAPYTDYYIWRDGISTDSGINPPNNWISVFGGSAWTWNEQRQQYYLHQFGTNQPDLNLENADVLSEINDILRFWLDKGFDGFRIGSVSHLVEDSSFRDEPINDNADGSVLESDYDYLEHIYTTNQEKSFDLVVQWRSVIDDYVASTGSETKFLAVESTSSTETALRFLGNDTNPGAHAPLNFNIVKNATRTSSSSDLISLTTEWLNLLSENIAPNWVLGSHDFDRVSSRFGINRIDGLHMLSLLLPGLSITYQGEELGLLNVPVSWSQTQDPKGLNAGESRFELFSRDPARTPFLWDSTSNAGFTTGASTWLPITSNFQDWNLAVQSSEDRSYYNTYKSLIEFRKLETFRRGATRVQSLNDNTVIAFSRELSNEHTYLVVINVDIYQTSVDLSGFNNLLDEDLVVCLASANSIVDTGADVDLSEVQLSANAALLLCPRSAFPHPVLVNDEIVGDLDWWQTAAIYQVYPKSFKDSNGDGVGDIQGIISQLDHFNNINIDAIWLGPVYTSPQYDHGYDVSNYRDVDPLFGTLADLESLLEQAHARGIKIILDFVPNHSSIEHEWFVNSVARVAPYTDYYIWRDGISTDSGINPPNNWISVFGGSAWTWNEQRQQYYLHQFGTNQPDLNLENADVLSEINDILRFWLEKGFDGFRIGSVSHLVEDSSFRDEPINENADDSVLESDYDYLEHIYTTNQEISFDLVVQWRSVIDDYVASTGSETKFLAVETTSNTATALRFLGNDTNPGAHAPLNFNIVKNATRTSSSSDLISLTTEWLNLLSENITPNWVLGSHDFDRVSSRFGINRIDGLHMLSLLLPGISVTYQGEELGLLNVPVSWSQTQDPKGLNAGESRFELFSRDPARTPFLWDSTSNAGFTTGSSTWLPITSNFQDWNLDVQSNADRSYYNTYKSLIEFRKLDTFRRGATRVQSLNDNTVIAFSRELSNGHTYLVVINVDIYQTSVDLTGFNNLLGEDLVVCLASANSIVDTGTDVNLSEVQLSANAAVIVCPRSALPEPITTTVPTTPADSTGSPIETETILANNEIIGDLDWWQTAAIYQVYPKSFKDSNGDGVGDIQGIISQLDHFTNINIDAIWLGPVYTSPQYDHGYDVSNYRDVDPLFGTLADLESLLEQAHARGIKIILDFVPNHSSIEHEWFVNSVARVAPYTDYYIWRDGVSTDSGINPPNNWISVFGGSAWTWNEQRQQYYLHQFGTNQPDLNLENADVLSEINDILRFWLDKGFDGFRIGSVSHLVEDSSFRDEPINDNADGSVLESDYDYLEHIYTTNQEKSFDLVVQWRSVIDDYVASTGSETKFLAVESTSSTETALRFLGNDTNPGAHAPLNFNIVKNATRTSSSSDLISLTTEWLNLLSENITPNWVLGSHDFDRVSSRFGINRADGLHMLSLLLPGLSVTYQGEELGLLNVPVSWGQTQDPKGLNAGESRFELFSRDPARTPFLWDSTSNAGFTTGPSTWLPITSNFQDWNLAVQSSEGRSYYNTYKSLIEFRKLDTFRRGATRVQSLNDNTVIAFSRELSNEHTYLVVINVDIYQTSVDLTGFNNLLGEDLVVCLASANSIVDTGADVHLSEVQLSANAALLLCPRSAFPNPVLVNDEIVGDLDWWQTAAIYQVYPKSFKDSNGDGVGDIQGIISQLDHFTNINIDAIWLGPVYTSPQYDHGYDVSNYRDVDPLFGTLADLESLLEQAHARGIKIILDFVPNHSSIEHEWFVNSVARVAPYTDYYIWRDGISTDSGINPPNNWISVFGGSAWTWNEQRQQYYLHQFGTNQPDLNLENADVLSEINDTLRFWLEKGFDGFRIGSVSHLVEDSSFRDEPINDNADDSVLESDYDYLEHIYTTNQEKSFDLVVQWRRVVDDYVASTGSETKFLAVEATANTHTALRFLGNDTNPGAHAPLNFNIVKNATRTSSSSDLISLTTEWLNLLSENITPNWVLGSHDFDRVSSRFGINRIDGLHMLSLLLPGISVTYQGEELGLLNVPVSWGQTQDPKGLNAGESRFELFSRDPARTPFLWDSTSNAGFTTGTSTWLPITSNFQDWNLDVQSNADRSYYNTYKSLIEFRKLETFRRGATRVQTLNDNTVIAFSRELSNEHTFLVIINVDIYRTSVDLTGFDNLLGEDLVVCLSSANSIVDTGTDVHLSEVELSANAALLVCPRSALPEPITTTLPTTSTDSTESPIETVPVLANDEIVGDLDWWQTAAIYQVYPKSFKDSNGDGIGDIQGIISQLDHFTNINIDAIWLGPVYTSPQYDHGYDVSNYRDVDPLFGTLADLESLLEQAHARGIKIILDFVPNHSSIEHEWFVNSVARVAPYTDYYIWRDGISTDSGINPPNNWISVFGGSAWTWNEQRQQYYLHQFGTNQPDLNLENADVLSEINDILRFWLEKGFDGFRIGSVSHLVEDSSFRDEPINDNADDSVLESDYDYLEHIYTTNQEKSFDLVIQWRRVIDDYVAATGSGTKFLAVEATANTATALRFLGNDTNPGAHAPLNFNIVKNATRTSSSSDLISLTTEWLNLLSENITPNWVLGSHDFDRVSSRFGINRIDGLHMLSLLLPGLSVTYQGEELGLLNVPVSWNETQDPKGLNAGEDRFELFSRDPARTPFLWDSTSNAGFTTGSSTWLPITSNFQNWNLAVQSTEDRSYYNTYKSLIEFRKLETFTRGATRIQSLNDNSVIAFTRELSNEPTYAVVINNLFYGTTVDLSGFESLANEDLIVCLASANSITITGSNITVSEISLSANAALLLCPRSVILDMDSTESPITTTIPTTTTLPTTTIIPTTPTVDDTTTDAPEEPESDEDSESDGAINITFSSLLLIITLLVTFI